MIKSLIYWQKALDCNFFGHRFVSLFTDPTNLDFQDFQIKIIWILRFEIFPTTRPSFSGGLSCKSRNIKHVALVGQIFKAFQFWPRFCTI
jgi:hypothetical protein